MPSGLPWRFRCHSIWCPFTLSMIRIMGDWRASLPYHNSTAEGKGFLSLSSRSLRPREVFRLACLPQTSRAARTKPQSISRLTLRSCLLYRFWSCCPSFNLVLPGQRELGVPPRIALDQWLTVQEEQLQSLCSRWGQLWGVTSTVCGARSGLSPSYPLWACRLLHSCLASFLHTPPSHWPAWERLLINHFHVNSPLRVYIWDIRQAPSGPLALYRFAISFFERKSFHRFLSPLHTHVLQKCLLTCF